MSFLYKARLQVNDMFSQFSRFIAPTYYHDRCERYKSITSPLVLFKG